MEDQQVISLLIKLNKNLKKIRKELRSRHKSPGADGNPKDRYTLERVMDELRRTRSTIYRYRNEGLIRCEKKAGISLFDRRDVEKLKYKCMK